MSMTNTKTNLELPQSAGVSSVVRPDVWAGDTPVPGGAQITATENTIAFRSGNFATLSEALDYAAQGVTGYNFYSRNRVEAVLSYAGLQQKAQQMARRLLGLGLNRGDRIALVAETTSDFVTLFFACHYAGLVPVPLPVSGSIGNRDSYTGFLRRLLIDSGSRAAMASVAELPQLKSAAEGIGLRFFGSPEDFSALPMSADKLHEADPEDLAYLQYTSGSTRFPKGVMIPHKTVMNNLAGIIQHGVDMQPGDRCVSWLPFYHDMGLVGLLLAPMAAQVSVDYIDTREFAVRPRRWMELISQNRATISFGPPFAYELVARRLRDHDIGNYDLSSWRVAGAGAEPIRAGVLEKFASRLAPAGFRESAFLPSYGMAECSLAVSFTALGQGLKVDSVDSERLSDGGHAVPAEENRRSTSYVSCGKPLPDFQVEIRNQAGEVVGERVIGTIFVKGPSVMSGYLHHSNSADKTLSEDGWLNTGDLAYQADGELYITGRVKDLIIVNGRNIWPQDIEYIAEQQDGVRPGDSLAFSVPAEESGEQTVLVVQFRNSDVKARADLVTGIQQQTAEELGIQVRVELVPLHTLPRTSSGKLSRSKARQYYLDA